MRLKNKFLFEFLACPKCAGPLQELATEYVCPSCQIRLSVADGRILVQSSPTDINPTNNERPDDPETWGAWRTANFEFLKKNLPRFVSPNGCVLDLGSGQFHFREVLSTFKLITCDIYPYPEVDVVCDATVGLPFKNASVDAVHLSNVLEHIYRPTDFLKIISSKLKPGGVMVAMVPFLLGEHQVPYDFHRYTRYCLERMITEAGLKMVEFCSWGDSLQLSTDYGWNAYRALQNPKQPQPVKRFYSLVLKILLMMMVRVSGLIRKNNNFDLQNSPLAENSAHGFMFVARKI